MHSPTLHSNSGEVLQSAEETLESSSVSFLSRPIPPYNTLMKLKREAVAPSKPVSKREADEADAPMTPMLPLSHAHTSFHSLALSPSLARSPSKTARHGGGIHLTAPESQERQQERVRQQEKVRRPSPALSSGSNASNLRMTAAPSHDGCTKGLDKEILWHRHYNLEGDITGRQESLMEREYQVYEFVLYFFKRAQEECKYDICIYSLSRDFAQRVLAEVLQASGES